MAAAFDERYEEAWTMIVSIRSLYLLLLANALMAICASPAKAAFLNLIARDVIQKDGSRVFSIESLVGGSRLVPISVTSPAGHTYSFPGPILLHSDKAYFPSLNEMIDSLSGEWTLQVAHVDTPNISETYGVTVESVPSEDLTAVHPTIIQPANGRVIHTDFDLVFTPPRGDHYFTRPKKVRVDFEDTTPGSVHFTPKFDKGQTGTIELGVVDVASLDHLISTVSPPENAAFFFTLPELRFYRESFVEVNAVPLPGDFNSDGRVNTDDYDIWKEAFGDATEQFAGADGNGDGHINAADYSVWRDNLDTMEGAASRAPGVPEPTALALVVLTSVALLRLRRRFR
jgi:hypothetical protein